MADAHALILGEDARDAQTLAEVLPLIVLQFASTVDGTRPTLAAADALARDSEFMRGLLVRIRTLLETLRERGRAFVRCPGCDVWETEMPMTAFAIAIAVPLPSAFDGPFLVFPSLTGELWPGPRPAAPRASQIRFELPSAELGLPAPISGGVLRDLAVESDDVYEKADGTFAGTGQRALTRLAAAIEPPLPESDADALPLVDVSFLDLLHFIAYRAPVNPDTRGILQCPRCATRFLPVGQEASADSETAR
jgi:hypothetical protein